MGRNKRIILTIVILSILVGIAFTIIYNRKNSIEIKRYVEHEDRMKEGVDTSLGVDSFTDEDYMVNEDFVSHLPLVVIDLGDKTIPDSYDYDEDEERFVLKDGADPYVDAGISIIDNDSNVNYLGDEPQISSLIKIKYRGNSSIVFDKHQYRFKLVDEEGMSRKENILGMGEESDWILNISMIDESLLRNYLCYTIGGQFMSYVPDVRFCEVLIKNEKGYEYQGLYLMMEPVEQGSDRVDISDYNPKNNYTSYLVRRDRYDEEGVMLDTYATLNQLCYGYLDLKYPKSSELTDDIKKYVTDDISSIEKVIFSKDENEFLTYPEYIDEDSFVDYFVFNEFFTNYDAGNNSTYMYKDDRGKLSIGPIWDYDNIADNVAGYLLDPEVISFEGQAWFKELLQSERFCRKLEKRYKELRKSYFSDEYINNMIDETVLYLGNAQKRDWSRWNEQYTSARFDIIRDKDGVKIDRNFDNYEDVVQRLKDVLNEHAYYILPELHKLTVECRYKDAYRIRYDYAALFMVVLFISIIIGRRKV